MANALSIVASLELNSGATAAQGKLVCPTFIASVVPTGNGAIKNIISVGTSDESLALGDITTIGYVWLHNLDLTNYITFGSDGTLYPLKLKAGEIALVRWNAAALHAKANTGACLLEYAIIED